MQSVIRMTNVRDAVEYYGLRVRMEKTGDPEREFFLTGETPTFVLVIENPQDRPRSGGLPLVWQLVTPFGQVMTTDRAMRFDCPPHEERRYPIQPEWLESPGYASYRLYLLFEPEALTGPIKVPPGATPGQHPLVTYEVVDKARHIEDERRDAVQKRTQVTSELTLVAFIASVGASIALAVVTYVYR